MKRILIIEDNNELQQLYQEALTQNGITVDFATSAQAGLSTMMINKPNLVILDVMLPDGSNGFDVLKAMKKDGNLRMIPVFMITNLDSQEKAAREYNVADYIVKTTSFDKIIDKITTFLK